MIKRLLLTVALIFAVGGISSAAIQNIIGVNVSGPNPRLLTTIAGICTGATCPVRFVQDFSASERYVGTTAAGRCMVSNDGFTWTFCPTDPPSTGASPLSIGATAENTWIAVQTNGATFGCRVSRSLDQGGSWAIVTELPIFRCGVTSISQMIQCTNTGGICVIYGWGTGNFSEIYRTDDNGLNWLRIYQGLVAANEPSSLTYDSAWGGFAIPIGSIYRQTVASTDTTASTWVDLGGAVAPFVTACINGNFIATIGHFLSCQPSPPVAGQGIFITTASHVQTVYTAIGSTSTTSRLVAVVDNVIYAVGQETTPILGCAAAFNFAIFAGGPTSLTPLVCTAALGFVTPSTMFVGNGKILVAGQHTAGGFTVVVTQ